MADGRWLTEADVAGAVDLRAATQAVRGALALQATGAARTLEKTAATWGDGHTLHALGGVADGMGLVGTKTWAHTEGGAAPLLVLWDAASGELRAVLEAFALGQLRTAAVSAAATDALAPADGAVMAMVGTGKQALPQVAAVLSVRPIRRVQVFSPTPERRAAFCTALATAAPGVDVEECSSVVDAVRGADVVTTATRSRRPLLDAADLGNAMHVNALGAITPGRCELAPDVAASAAVVVSDSPATAVALSDELAAAGEVVDLASVVQGWTRTRPGPTLFKAMGLGLADVAIGAAVLRLAPDAGRPIPAPRRLPPRLFREEPND